MCGTLASVPHTALIRPIRLLPSPQAEGAAELQMWEDTPTLPLDPSAIGFSVEKPHHGRCPNQRNERTMEPSARTNAAAVKTFVTSICWGSKMIGLSMLR